jgi:hypothetical protein
VLDIVLGAWVACHQLEQSFYPLALSHHDIFICSIDFSDRLFEQRSPDLIALFILIGCMHKEQMLLFTNLNW